MKKLIDNISFEFRLGILKKSVVILAIVMFGCFIIAQFNAINKFKDYKGMYISSLNEAKVNGENVNKLLNEPLEIEVTNDRNGAERISVKNALKYDYKIFEEAYLGLLGENIPSNLLKNTTLIYLAIVWGVYMAYTITQEASFGTLKYRSLFGDSKRILESKFILGIGNLTVATLISLIVASITAVLWANAIKDGN